VFDHSGEYPLRFPEPIAGIKQAIDHGAIARPLLDFVEVAAVRQERIVGFLWAQSLIVGPLAAVARASLHALRSVIQLNCEIAVFIRTRLQGRRKPQARRYATRLWSKTASSASGDGELSRISKLGDRHKIYRCFGLRVIGRWATLARSCIR